jgi:hypothetical protein
MKYVVEIGSGAMMYILRLMKIGSAIESYDSLSGTPVHYRESCMYLHRTA